MSAVSSSFRDTLQRALGEERAISLSLMVCLFQPRLACNLSGRELSPTHASLRSATADHDYYFELLREEERDAQSICSMFYCTPWRFPSCPACQLGPAAREIS